MVGESSKRRPRETRAPKYPDAERAEIVTSYVSIVDELTNLLADVVARRLRNRIQQADRERDAKATTLRADGIGEDIERAFDEYDERAANILRERARAAARRAALGVSRANGREVTRVLDALGARIVQDPATIQDLIGVFVSNNESLLRDVSSTMRAEVAGAVGRGMQSGTRWEGIAQEIAERAGVARSRAELIARDQAGKVFSALTRARSQAAGIGRYEWVTSHDERVRVEHRVLDGRIFSWDDPPDVGNPGEPINCRCVAAPVFDDD